MADRRGVARNSGADHPGAQGADHPGPGSLFRPNPGESGQIICMTTPTEPPQSPPPQQPPPGQPPEAPGGGGGGSRFPTWAIAVIIGVIVLCCLAAGIVAALSLGGEDGNDREDERPGGPDNGPYDQGRPDRHAWSVPGDDPDREPGRPVAGAESGHAADLRYVLPA